MSYIGDEIKTHQPNMSYPLDENLFYSAAAQHGEDEAASDDDAAYEEPAADELLPPPDFKPFFTLIEDPVTGEHHHPTVHYMFSDDDPEVLTSAALDVLDKDGVASQANSRVTDVNERCVIVDMEADGKSVKSASSISPDWQALKTTITQAPSWGDDSNGTDRGMMLKISGQASGSSSSSKDKKRRQEKVGNIDDLLREFGERLEGLDEILGRSQQPADDRGTT